MSILSRLLYIILTGMLFFSTTSQGADIEDGVIININQFANRPSLQGNNLPISPLLTLLPKNTRHISTRKRGISYFEIVSVGSSQLGWIDVGQSQRATELAHGGSQLLIAVLQYGKGHSPQASLNGITQTTRHLEYLCGNLTELHLCQAGEKISAWLHYFDFSGQNQGYLNVTSYSDGHPFYWSDTLYVQ
ncbi:DUF4879 domain-containing protein [Shewanella surugensis]|uniref:YolA family protein n=1 Tax=Shewanella surugensis TaxID=212020 RepID=A0ABT0L5J2_9GAMM|nr:DUF4879 domain-containing protein [Shewanella surugensis]MCL1122957.1 YolA family protein [Shewanella surugensis]